MGFGVQTVALAGLLVPWLIGTAIGSALDDPRWAAVTLGPAIRRVGRRFGGPDRLDLHLRSDRDDHLGRQLGSEPSTAVGTSGNPECWLR